MYVYICASCQLLVMNVLGAPGAIFDSFVLCIDLTILTIRKVIFKYV